MTEPRMPIYPAEWLDPEPAPSGGMQDGMLEHFLAQPSDWKIEKQLEREPFDFRDHLSNWARTMALTKFRQK